MKVYIGIDWSEKKHDVCFINEAGDVLLSLSIEHTISGFSKLEQCRQSFDVEPGECIVGLETAHNLLVDFLWDQGYTQIYMLPPLAVKSAQGRFRQSGAKDDPWDARLIADMLRTDRSRYNIWKPDQPLTRRIRAEVRFAGQLNRELLRGTNRIRSYLLRYYPVATVLFSKLHSQVSLAFLQAYPTAELASALSFDDLKVFCHQHHHTHSKSWPEIYARLQGDHPRPNPDVEQIYSSLVLAEAKILEPMVKGYRECITRLTQLYNQHPDRAIYDSLPGAGAYLSPALLCKLGDDRNRFPTPSVLQAVAGTCPVTYRSGKHSRVNFRFACDREFRTITQEWARETLAVSPWAIAYFRSVRPRCQTDSDAIRRLANRWLEVLWRLWVDKTLYDEGLHLKKNLARKNVQ